MQITRMTASRSNPYFKQILHCLRLEKFHGWLGYVVIVEVQVWIRSLTLDRDGHVEQHISGKDIFILDVVSSSLKWFFHDQLMKIFLVFYPHCIPYQVISESMVWLGDRLGRVLGQSIPCERDPLEREIVGMQVWVKLLTLDRAGHVEQLINGKDPYT